MKVKKDACMRSLTALLRPPNLKNSSDSNEECEPWYTTVPSITYIWTHRPQWRRRHKNRKKVKTIPVTFINSGAKEDKNRHFWETLRPQERPCSRSSTSPYETCSSRQILTESELMRNCGSQRNREVLMSKKKSHSANRKVLVYETHSDSGLRILRGTKLLGLIRSQKRLGVGNSANSQNTIGTLSSLEVNRSGQLFACKALKSEYSIPKRRVTFSNYVSENSVTDTRSQISSIIMNDNETSDNSWCQRSYVRLTDDEDNCSMQTDLSCLISSIIFDESKSSFFSLTSGKNSEKQRKSHTDLNSEFNDSFFYVNSSYSNGSSCNLLSLSTNFSSDDFRKSNGSSLIDQNRNNATDFEKNTLTDKFSQSSVSKEIIPLIKITENVTVEPSFKSTSCIVDVVTKELAEKLSQLSSSNDVVSVFKTDEDIKTETVYSRTPRIIDIMKKQLDENLSQSSLSIGIEPAFERNVDVITDTLYRRTKCADNFVRHKLRENRIETNKIVTGTGIAEETKSKLTSNHTPRIVNVKKTKLEDNLSQLSHSNNIIAVVNSIVDGMKKKLDPKLSQSNFMDSVFKTPEDIITQSMYSHIPCTDDFGNNKWRENFIESNQIVVDIKKAEETEIEHTYSRTLYTVDVMNKKLEENMSESSPLNDINPVFQISKDIPIKSGYTTIPRSKDFTKNQWGENLIESNKIVSDTKKVEKTRTKVTCSRSSYTDDVMMKKVEENLSQSSSLNDINPVFQISEDIPIKSMYTSIPRSNDFMKNQCRENLMESNKRVSDTKKVEETRTELRYSRSSYTDDVMMKKVEENLSQSSPLNDINPVFQISEDIPIKPMYTSIPRSNDFTKNQCRENLMESNKIVSDTKKVEETRTALTYSRSSYTDDVMTKKVEKNSSQSSPLNDINSVFQISEDIPIIRMYTRIPRSNDFTNNQWRDNLLESNKIVSDTKKVEKTRTKDTCSRSSYTDDVMMKKVEENLSQSSPLNDINPIFQISEDIPIKSMYTSIPRSNDFMKNQCRENLMESNKSVSDTKKVEETRTELMYGRSSDTDDVMMKKVEEKLSQSNLSNEIIPVFKKPKGIISEPMYCFTRRTDDFVEKQWKENRNESNEIGSDIEISGKIKSDPTNNSIECITIELKDISSTVKEVFIESRFESDNEDYAPIRKNDISTNTSDLIAFNLIPSLDPKTQLLNNAADNGILDIDKIFNFLQQPPKSLDASLLIEELATVVEQPFGNCYAINKLDNVDRKKSKESTKEIEDQVKLFRIDTETCGEYESLFIEMKDFHDDFEKNEVLEKRSSLLLRDCCEEPCDNGSVLVRNYNGSSKHSKLVRSSTSHFHNEYAKCSAGGKCCLVCGRRGIDNPRYIRPVCRVKGGTWSPHSEKDPWINVIKKVVKYDNHKELIPQKCTIPKNEEILKDQELTEELPKKSASNTDQNTLNETPTEYKKKSEYSVKNEDEEEECLSVIITQADDPSLPISPADANVNIPSSRTDRSTSCCPPELHSSTSFGFATFRGPRTQSAKTYFMRESVRTVQGTANRLLCVISESDSLMAVPPFLPKKPPNWFARQMPTRRCLRR